MKFYSVLLRYIGAKTLLRISNEIPLDFIRIDIRNGRILPGVRLKNWDINLAVRQFFSIINARECRVSADPFKGSEGGGEERGGYSFKRVLVTMIMHCAISIALTRGRVCR